MDNSALTPSLSTAATETVVHACIVNDWTTVTHYSMVWLLGWCGVYCQSRTQLVPGGRLCHHITLIFWDMGPRRSVTVAKQRRIEILLLTCLQWTPPCCDAYTSGLPVVTADRQVSIASWRWSDDDVSTIQCSLSPAWPPARPSARRFVPPTDVD